MTSQKKAQSLRGASRLCQNIISNSKKTCRLSYSHSSLTWCCVDFQMLQRILRRTLLVELRTEDINFQSTFIYRT